jgi:hypothetical protein
MQTEAPYFQAKIRNFRLSETTDKTLPDTSIREKKH